MPNNIKTWWLATPERKLLLGIVLGVIISTIYNQIG